MFDLLFHRFVEEDYEDDDDENDEQSSMSVSSEEDDAGNSGGKDFASAFSDILQQKSSKEPILSMNTGFAAQIKKQKMESQITKKVSESRKALREQWHVECDAHNDAEKERMLRKVATRGVVKLFNAIKTQQRSFTEDKEVQSLSKDSFLSMLKQGGGTQKKIVYSKSKVALGNERGEEKKTPWLRDDFLNNEQEYEEKDFMREQSEQSDFDE